jgi:leader peptidase (prepilin peptidase)/N-methyltransferase
MVPILSYLWLRGRCRECGASIPPRVFVVEVMTALLFAAAYWRVGLGLEFAIISLSASLLLAVAVIDLEHQLILNRIIFPSAVVFLLLAPFWTELDMPRTLLESSGVIASFLNSVASGVGAFLLFLIIFIVYPQGMGGGDVKLAGLIGLMVGYPGVIAALWSGIVAGGVVALALLALRRKGRKDAMPFGPFLALGGIVVLLAGSDLLSAYNRLVDSVAGV